MRVIKFLRFLPLLLMVVAGCRGISVQSAHDAEVDFKKLHTFDWLSVPAEVRTAVGDEVMRSVLGAELEKKGLRRSQEQPDLLVAVHRTIDGTLNTKGSGYEFRDGRIARYELQSGTLVVDLIAAPTRQSVWRGTADGVFRFDLLPAERRQLMEEVLHDMFDDFPPR